MPEDISIISQGTGLITHIYVCTILLIFVSLFKIKPEIINTNSSLIKALPGVKSVKNARVLLNLGDSVTTDHISPAGSIARNSPAARFLASKG